MRHDLLTNINSNGLTTRFYGLTLQFTSPVQYSVHKRHFPVLPTTIFVLIAAHAPISAYPPYFEVINHRIINHLPDLFIKFTYLVQYDWELA